MLNKIKIRPGKAIGSLCFYLAIGLLFSPAWVFSQSGQGDRVLDLDLEKNELPSPLNMHQVVSAIGYPDSAKDAGLEGIVYVRILVDKEGQVDEFKILKSPGEWLSKAVVDHIHKLRFTPGKLDGVPVKVWVTLPVNFALNEKQGQEEEATEERKKKRKRKKRR